MQKPRGTKDNFGFIQDLRDYVLKILNEISLLYNFKKIDTPIFEIKSVFTRAVGLTSDVVTKEMYEFEDKGGRSLVLRPEGTAGLIRAVVENKIYAQSKPIKLYYEGPMFRYENPQQGRQRQFTQYGVELLAEKSPYLDAEIILMGATILDALNLDYKLVINSLGDKITRENWTEALRNYFHKYRDKLSNNSLKRLDVNPMRILDDKIDGKKDFVKNAPKISKFYSSETVEYFNQVTSFLKNMGIKYDIDHTLVRGLDYYTDTAFEFISIAENVGSQSTLIGGGRYENLVAQFGGPNLSGVGFGVGIERIVNDLKHIVAPEKIASNPSVYVINMNNKTSSAVLGIVYMLRKAGIATEWNYKPLKLLKGFAKAESSQAKIVIIAGPKDLANNVVNVKVNKDQKTIKLDDLVVEILKMIGEIYEKN